MVLLKTEQNILEAVKALGAKDSYPIDTIRGLNGIIIDYLETIDSIERYSEAGSFRRYKEMSKDLDYIISTEHPDEVQQQLLNIPNKVKDVVVGQTKVSLELTYDDETIGVDFALLSQLRSITHYNILLVLKIITFVLDKWLKRKMKNK